MSWISILLLYGLVTTLTGTLMLAIWFLCRLFLVRWNPNLIYYMLRWVVVMFLLPVSCSALWLMDRNSYIQHVDGFGHFVFLVNPELLPIRLLMLVWLAATIVNIVRYLWKYYKRHQLCKGNFEEDDPQVLAEFERIKEILGVRGKITLLWNDLIQVPTTTGIFRKKVILPYGKYKEDELKAIFYHELTHFKKHDLIFKMLSILIVIIESINPAAYFLVFLLNEWSECSCDSRALEYLAKEGIRSKRYYEIIFDFLENQDRFNADINMLAMFFEEKTSLERRIKFVGKYIKNAKKVSKAVTAALVIVFALTSTVTSYAAGVKIAEINDTVLKESQNIEIIDCDPLAEAEANCSEEFTVTAEESKGVEIICMDENDGIMPLSNLTFDWTVPAGVRAVSSPLYLARGAKVTITCVGDPSDCTYWMGIQHSSSDCTVVEVTGVGTHTFEIPSTGSYCIMIENRSSKEIQATGVYSYSYSN